MLGPLGERGKKSLYVRKAAGPLPQAVALRALSYLVAIAKAVARDLTMVARQRRALCRSRI